MTYKYGYETAVAAVALMLAGLFGSRFLISTGTIALSVLWLVLPGTGDTLRRWRTDPLARSAAVILLVYLLSGLNSSNVVQYLDELKNKLPYAGIPLSLLAVKPFSGSARRGLRYLFLLLLGGSALYTFWYYATAPGSVAEAYTRGQILPTVMHHVSYSLLLVCGVLVCADQWHAAFEKRTWGGMVAYALIGGALILLIHLLATRTGLVCLYSTLSLYILACGLRKKAYAALALSLAAAIAVFVALFLLSPTIKHKLAYMRYDLQRAMSGHNPDNQLSDSRRILSDRLGWEIFTEKPLTGTGIGDLRDELQQRYTARYPEFAEETRGLIHNQYLYILAACGIVLGLLFFAAVSLPVYIHFRNGQYLAGCLYLGAWLVLFWEPFLEYQHGNTIYLLLLIFGIQSTERA